MAILTMDKITKPYDDDFLNWDIDKQRYILVPEKADFETALVLSELWEGNDNVLWYLDAVSRVCYTSIFKFKDPKYRKRLEYYLSHSKEMRKAIFELMVDTIQYNFEDGGFLIAYQTGINLHEMKEIRMKIANVMSVVGDQIMENHEMKERIIRWNVNDFTYLADLTALLAYMVTQGFMTQEVADEVETINDISSDYRYRVFVIEDGRYVCEDMLTFKKALESYGVDW